MSLSLRLKSLFNPNMYHGWGQTKRYFEGWYFKVLNKDQSCAFAFIPGIAMDADGKKHAFIQVLDGLNYTAENIIFDAEVFNPSKEKFAVKIQNNFFSSDKLQLDLDHIQGSLYLKNLNPWPNQWYSPGIMGPFSFVPFMQCYHGIVSMNHRLEGSLVINGKEIDFTGGKGYLEKDWGRSFPEAYFWMQSNHFENEALSVKASVAKIPWLGSSFVGFIAGVQLEDRLIQFTTYHFARLKKSFADQDHVELVMTRPGYQLKLYVKRDRATELASPIQGFMDGRVEESMSSEMHLELIDTKTNKIIISDHSTRAAVEVAGKIDEIMI